MQIVGKTEDGVLVVSEIFEMFDSKGLPLEDIILLLKENNMIIDWIDFYKDAMKKGWSLKTFYERLEVLEDIFDKKYKDEVLRRLVYYVEINTNNI